MEGRKEADRAKGVKKPTALPKYYANACEEMPGEYSDYSEAFDLHYGKIESYEIVRKIGRGRYSDVYEGVKTGSEKKVAIKILKPIKKEKVKREVKILQTLKGGPNIVNYVDIVKDSPTKTISIIMDYEDYQDTDFRLIYKKTSPQDLKLYMFEILKALDFAHSKGIMHRDIKPHNILIDQPKKKLTIIDWGLAEFYKPKEGYNTKVAALFYKAPELLLDYCYYDYSVDIWSLGCIFAAFVFQQDQLFHGKDKTEVLVNVAKILGTDEILAFIRKSGLKVPTAVLEQLGKRPKKQWLKFKASFNEAYFAEEALNLITEMLTVDPEKRITAKDAMKHPYFTATKNSEEEKH